MLIYEDLGHVYFDSTNPDYKFMSVTTAIKSKKISAQESHWAYWALYKVLEARIPNFKQIKPMPTPPLHWLEKQANAFNPTEIEQEILALRKKWAETGDEAATEGTEQHSIQEELAHISTEYRNPFTGKLVPVERSYFMEGTQKISKYATLEELPDGLHPEQMLWYLFMVGTSDQVFIETIGTKRYVDINDFKFKAKFKKQNNFQNFMYPWNNLDESDLNTAALQLSFYAYFLEQNGFTPRYLGVTLKGKLIPVMYYREEVRLFLEEFTSPVEEMPPQEYLDAEDLI